MASNRGSNPSAKRRKVNAPQDHTLHTIASYNMSFASDLGINIGSEKHFISDSRKRATALGLDNTGRSSWERAALLVRHFWENDAENHYPSAIGLQEMNTSAIVKVGNPQFAGGDERLAAVLHGIDGLNLQFYTANVPGNGGSPTLVTVWDGDKLGGRTHDYYADLGLEESFLVENENPAEFNVHRGRPISIVCTEKGFTLINLHGPNISAQSHTLHMAKLRAAINRHVGLFIARDGIQINPHKLFVMGDFNDPFNAINRNEPLFIGNIPVHYNTEADGTRRVKSCCYNFNSACPEGDWNPQNIRHTRADGLIADEQECYIVEHADQALNQRLRGFVKSNATNTLHGQNIPELSVGARGHLANYRFTGDYAMGVNVEVSLQSYRAAYQPVGFRQDVSMESDHEMVFATFKSPIAGGRRMRRTRHKALRTHHKALRTHHKARRGHHKQRRTRHKARRTRRN
jgi:hypothetical protein